MADCVAADALLDQMSTTDLVHGDKGYDTDAVRRKIEAKGAAPNIPPKSNRVWKSCFSHTFTAIAMPSSACSAGSKISAASQPDTTLSPRTSLLPSASQPLSVTGYESWP